MVPDPGAASGADRLRPLNQPRPVTVLTADPGAADDSGPVSHVGMAHPIGLVERGRHYRIEQVQDSWRIDDEWWRAPINRRYYQLVLDDGSLRTVYQDLVDGRWYEQRY